ncbi:MAG: DNA/RNA nuclease SfsA [Proteobacteria bacterium]|nr:DNA/RNA nuclease SfsA [Pseudomonadota bacterium]
MDNPFLTQSSDYRKGIFLSRINRFILECCVDGEVTKVYMPNPGRLIELLHPGVILYLETNNSPEKKYRYMVIGIKTDSCFINLHTHQTNYIVQELLENKLITSISYDSIDRREARLGNSRFDFLLSSDNEPIWVEVKSCSQYTKKTAMFPDAPTARGKKHVDKLIELGNKKIKTAIIFMIQNPKIKYFLPDYHTDLEFAKSFKSARGIVSLVPIAVALDKKFRLNSFSHRLIIPWPLIERESHDSGCYLFIGYLECDQLVTIGKLGSINFKRGYYIYVGSAKIGLSKRIARHQRVRKKKHWHLDYLRPYLKVISALPIRTQDPIECDLAGNLDELADWKMNRFGSSDCHCRSHLFGFNENPLHNRGFIDFLHYFRIDRFDLDYWMKTDDKR